MGRITAYMRLGLGYLFIDALELLLFVDLISSDTLTGNSESTTGIPSTVVYLHVQLYME